MSPAVLSLTVSFVSLVYGMYQSGHFIYKGQVSFTNRWSVIKEIFVPSNANELVYCGLQCVREPYCLAIEMCPRDVRQLCRLCNSTNPSFTENETDPCRYLQLTRERDETDSCSKVAVGHTCKDIKEKLNNSTCGLVSSGVYSINIDDKPTDVWCDMETDGGGWTVIQRRQNGNTDFFRTWSDYKIGFGNVSDEYWIGNNVLHRMTTTRNVTLRVDLEQFNGIKGYGVYTTFRVHNEAEEFILYISGYSGTINDCLNSDNNNKFSTKDRDNDDWSDNCAANYQGGWWYSRCTSANLNGRYQQPGTVNYTSVYCYQWKNYTALKSAIMMIR